MKLRTAAVGAAAVAAILAGSAGITGTASAAPQTGHSSAWYDAATCQAFFRWYHREAGFSPVTRLSRHADYFLRFDVNHLNHARTHHFSRRSIADDAYTVYLDCTLGPDE